MESIFEGCTSLEEFYFGNVTFKKRVSFFGVYRYYTIIDYLYPKSVIKMNRIFKNCISLKKINISEWNIENTIRMSYMFENCISLENVILGDYNVNNLQRIDYIFKNCSSLKYINLQAFNNTYNIISMSHMFENCQSLINLDFSSFDITKVEDIRYMFSGCTSLAYVDFSNIYNNNKIKFMDSLPIPNPNPQSPLLIF